MTTTGKSAKTADRPATVVSDVGQFAIVPTWLLASGVSDRAVRLFACLAGKYADFKTQEACPSRRALATDLGCSLSSADRAIDELIRVRALAVEPRQATNGDFISNIYKIRIATPEGLQRVEPRVDPGPGIRDQGAPNQVRKTEGGVYSPVTTPLVMGEQGVYSPVTSALVTGDYTEEIIPTTSDQERTPPNPLAGGTFGRVSTRKPSKAERDWAERVLDVHRFRPGCPHDAEHPCETRAKCIGKLVAFQRQQTLEGMHEELGLVAAQADSGQASAHDAHRADTS
jgi:hypothetical protein